VKRGDFESRIRLDLKRQLNYCGASYKETSHKGTRYKGTTYKVRKLKWNKMQENKLQGIGNKLQGNMHWNTEFLYFLIEDIQWPGQ
jgi:hypothetical protein